MTIKLIRTPIAIGLTVLAIIVAVALVAAFATSPGQAANQAGRGAPNPGHAFGVFGAREARAQSPSEAAIGKEVVASLGMPDGLGPDPATLRLARTMPDGDKALVLRGTAIVCFAIRGADALDRSLDCGGVRNGADVSQKPPVFVSGPGTDGGRMSALVGDGIEGLTLTSGSGNQALTPVDNIVSAKVPSGPSTLTWHNPDGTTESIDMNKGAR